MDTRNFFKLMIKGGNENSIFQVNVPVNLSFFLTTSSRESPIQDSQKNIPGIITIPRVPIMQNNAFQSSQLKILITDPHFLLEKDLFPEVFFQEKDLIPEFPEPPSAKERWGCDNNLKSSG